MSIFTVLKRKKRISLIRSEEYAFYAENTQLLSRFTTHYHMSQPDTTGFKIIQCNILIRAIKNKDIIEKNLEKYSLESLAVPVDKRDRFIRDKVWEDLENAHAPYFEIDKGRIYIPFFSRGLNLIYNDQPTRLMDYPYNELKDKPLTACIDLFDMYNFSLFSSTFTSLIKIKEDKTSAAYYHKEFETIYIINNQGRLDVCIPIFDRYLKTRNEEHLIRRIERVVTAYYSNDCSEFIKSLYEENLISHKTFIALARSASKKAIKKDKIFNRGKSPDEVL